MEVSDVSKTDKFLRDLEHAGFAPKEVKGVLGFNTNALYSAENKALNRICEAHGYGYESKRSGTGLRVTLVKNK